MRAKFCVVLFLVIFIGCQAKPRQDSDLRNRITAANTSQACHSPIGCFNPHILVFEGGYTVTTFVGGTPQHAVVHPDKLREQLRALPMNAWPQGPMITITPSDDVIDWEAIKKNMTEAERVCRSLGLDVKFRPGG